MKTSIFRLIPLLALATFSQAGDWPPKLWKVIYGPASAGCLEQLKELIEQGADVNAPVGFDRKLREGEDPAKLIGTAWPLDVAVQHARLDMVTLLLAHGAKIRGGELAQAGLAGNEEESTALTKALLTAGAEANSRHDGFTALFWACDKGNKRSVKLLLAAPHLKLNETSGDGDTALMTAVCHGQSEIVSMLVKAGANTQIVNQRGETAITIAQQKLEEKPEAQMVILAALRTSPL